PAEVMGRWRRAGDHASFSRFTQSSTTNYSQFLASDALFNSNRSYVRLRNVSLSYQFPKVVLKACRLKGASVSVEGQNLVTLTGYNGLDVETGGLVMPPQRILMLGL